MNSIVMVKIYNVMNKNIIIERIYRNHISKTSKDTTKFKIVNKIFSVLNNNANYSMTMSNELDSNNAYSSSINNHTKSLNNNNIINNISNNKIFVTKNTDHDSESNDNIVKDTKKKPTVNKSNNTNGVNNTIDKTKVLREYLDFICNNTIHLSNYTIKFSTAHVSIYNKTNKKLVTRRYMNDNSVYSRNKMSRLMSIVKKIYDIKLNQSEAHALRYFCHQSRRLMGSIIKAFRKSNDDQYLAKYMQMQEKVEEQMRSESKKGSAGDMEHIYKPYWDGGEEVFYRTGAPLPNRGFLTAANFPFWYSSITPRHTTPDPKLTPFDVMSAYRGCDRVCSAYAGAWFGEVCCARLDTQWWFYEYQEFSSICEMESSNCQAENRSWYPVHSGRCAETDTFNFPEEQWGENIVAHAGELLEQYLTYVIPSFTRKYIVNEYKPQGVTEPWILTPIRP